MQGPLWQWRTTAEALMRLLSSQLSSPAQIFCMCRNHRCHQTSMPCAAHHWLPSTGAWPGSGDCGRAQGLPDLCAHEEEGGAHSLVNNIQVE